MRDPTSNEIPPLPQWGGPPNAIVQFQSMLYSDLTATLFSAFLVMLSKQWLNPYTSVDVRGYAVEYRNASWMGRSPSVSASPRSFSYSRPNRPSCSPSAHSLAVYGPLTIVPRALSQGLRRSGRYSTCQSSLLVRFTRVARTKPRVHKGFDISRNILYRTFAGFR